MNPPEPITVLRKHKASVTSVCFKNEKLYSTSNKGELFVWDIKTRRVTSVVHDFIDNDDGYLRVCANEDNIVANSRLGRLEIYDINTNRLVKEVKTGLSAGFAGCRINGTDVVFADAFDGKLCVYDMKAENWFPIATIAKHGMIMDISVKGDSLAVCMEDSTVYMYDQRNTAEPIWTQTLSSTDPSISISILDENQCFVGGSNTSLYVVSEKEVSSFYTLPHAGIDDIALRDDGRICVFTGWDGRIRLFDVKKRKPLAVLKHHSGCTHTVAFAENGIFATAGEDRGIALWDLYKDQYHPKH